MNGWIGVDFDGTLATYDHWRGPEHIGEPIAPMVERVKGWLAEGKEVRIFTARVYEDPDGMARSAVMAWCEEHLGQVLPITCTKDHRMIELWDDRCVQVETNTGRTMEKVWRDDVVADARRERLR